MDIVAIGNFFFKAYTIFINIWNRIPDKEKKKIKEFIKAKFKKIFENYYDAFKEKGESA
jgi:hypothetical protein